MHGLLHAIYKPFASCFYPLIRPNHNFLCNLCVQDQLLRFESLFVPHFPQLVRDNVCYYRDYRSDSASSYEATSIWYQVMLARVVFVIVFEHVVFLTRDCLAWIVPDVPKHVATNIKRETYLGKKALYGVETQMTV